MLTPGNFVWPEPTGDGRNVFALFRRDLNLIAAPQQAVLQVFADTRYRLRVNDAVVAYGPARFHPSRPEADSHDLAPFLTTGTNVITVEVNHRGANAFDARPSRGAFAAAGSVDGQDLASPGAWRSRICAAWDGEAPCFSFAQGPTEIVDTRRLDPAWFLPGDGGDGWTAPLGVAEPQRWGAMQPRSIPLLDTAEREAARVSTLATLAAEFRIGFREEGTPSRRGADRAVRRSVYAVCLHSPRAQTVTIGMFWGPHWLNGEDLPVANQPGLGNRQEATVALRAGWNLLYGEPEVMAEAWPVLVALPPEAGITASASEHIDDAAWMRRAGPFTDAELAALRPKAPRSHADLPAFPWRSVPRGHVPVVPARDACWDRPAESLPRPLTAHEVVLPGVAPGAIAVYDLDGEYHGHVVVEVTAPAGTVVDVAVAERLRADGFLALSSSNWMTNEAERFVVRGGRQRLEGFHPRGGRYVAVIVRGAPAVVTVHRVAVRETVYPQRGPGRFTCSDPLLTWIHETGVRTLRVCMTDTFMDCPWRERGAYVGDTLVQFGMARQLDADLALAKRTLRVFADCQRADGMIPGMAPSWQEGPLLDYCLLWVVAVHAVWAADGDLAWVRTVWPAVRRALDSEAFSRDAEGVVTAMPGQGLYLDVGIPAELHTGRNGALNAIHVRALADGADLAQRLGEHADAQRLGALAQRARAAFLALFSDPIGFRALPERPGLDWHATAYALGLGLVPDDRVPAIAAAIAANPPARRQNRGEGIDLYPLAFLLDGLYAHGQAALAEHVIRVAYAPMHAAGAWTLWEYVHDGASLCHAWSGGPLRHFGERTLGVRAAAEGDPDHIVIAPESALSAAEGVVAHRRGPISVRWQVDGPVLRLHVRTPPGVTVTRIGGAGPLADKRLVLDHGVNGASERAGALTTSG